MSKAITVRLPDATAAQLAERKKKTLVPTETFIRSLIDHALSKPTLANYYAPPPLTGANARNRQADIDAGKFDPKKAEQVNE